MRMNASKEAAVSHRRPHDPDPYRRGESSSDAAPVREEMLYRMDDDFVHWQFPRIIVGYQPMRPVGTSGVQGVLQPTMMYRADGMVYHLRNEDLTEPRPAPEVKPDNRLRREENPTRNDSRRQPDSDDSKRFVSAPPDYTFEDINCRKKQPVVESRSDETGGGSEGEEVTAGAARPPVVKTVASQTNITLQSPDSLSVKKSYDCNNTAKVVLKELPGEESNPTTSGQNSENIVSRSDSR